MEVTTSAQIPESVTKFLKSKNVLIVDPSSASRMSVLKALGELGLDRHHVQHVKTFADAVADIKKRQPALVISEFNIESKFGLDLLREQVENLPNPTEKIFILITGNASESAVAEAAEEDVDCYILKPFSTNILVDQLKRVISDKVRPSPLQIALQEGKEALAKDDVATAKAKFSHAKSLDKKSALACFYLGQAFEKGGDLSSALNEYNQGLKITPNHYKCMTGVFEALEKQDRKKEAYTVIQTLVKHFPVSPQRLGKVFTLAATTYNFVDIEKYYDYFNTLDRRPPELTRTVVAGLIVCGKALLRKKEIERAIGVFVKASNTCSRDVFYMEKMINSLVEIREYEAADKMLRMFNPPDQMSDLFKKLDFVIANGLDSPDKVAEKGRRLIQDGLHDRDVYRIVAQRMVEGNRITAAEAIIYKGIEKFPDLRQSLLALLDGKSSGNNHAA